MSNWRAAKSLLKLRDQVNAVYPQRSKKSDGLVGDARHQASKASDHNPHVRDASTGVVTALDLTHDPANGLHARELAESLIASRDPRIKYIISEGQICSSKQQPWKWRKYTGANGHFHHVHISVMPQKSLYDDTTDWAIDSAQKPVTSVEPAEPRRPILKKGDRGNDVVFLQKRLRITADGIFGSGTEKEVKAFQKQKGLSVDGIVGRQTWAKLL